MAEKDLRTEQRRAYYRIVYPPDKRPLFLWNGRAYAIVDLSESGVRFVNRRGRIVEDMLRGTIKFRDGVTVDVVGKVVRVDRDSVALFLIRGIPYKMIHQQQIALRSEP